MDRKLEDLQKSNEEMADSNKRLINEKDKLIEKLQQELKESTSKKVNMENTVFPKVELNV